MLEISTAAWGSELAAFCSLPGSPLQASGLDGEEHLIARTSENLEARCSLWWRSTPNCQNSRVGFIGHFAALTSQAARALLDDACRRLAARGCALAIGPVDGSTWKRYRLLTERGSDPPFFLEPDNPDDWPSFFSAAGFTPLAHYSSARDEDLRATDPRAPAAEQRMRSLGVEIRQLDPRDFRAEVGRIFDVSVISFQRAFLYTPIERAECMALYQPLERYVRPELVLIAEQRETPVGFIFGLPDWLQAQRGVAIDTVVIKTVAILPNRELGGLGALLVARCRERAAELGYTRAIHALMHDDNIGSHRISDRFAKTMRGYTLFARRISPKP